MNKEQFFWQFRKTCFDKKLSLQILTHAAWSFSMMSLFSGHEYNHLQEVEIKERIYLFLSIQPDLYDGYIEFCERILLAIPMERRQKEYKVHNSALEWIRPGEPGGFENTRALFHKNNPSSILRGSSR